jgi:hypothetical protein
MQLPLARIGCGERSSVEFARSDLPSRGHSSGHGSLEIGEENLTVQFQEMSTALGFVYGAR